ncbi:unnamed protein product, partial [Amoebophrya sp. A25]
LSPRAEQQEPSPQSERDEMNLLMSEGDEGSGVLPFPPSTVSGFLGRWFDETVLGLQHGEVSGNVRRMAHSVSNSVEQRSEQLINPFGWCFSAPPQKYHILDTIDEDAAEGSEQDFVQAGDLLEDHEQKNTSPRSRIPSSPPVPVEEEVKNILVGVEGIHHAATPSGTRLASPVGSNASRSSSSCTGGRKRSRSPTTSVTADAPASPDVDSQAQEDMKAKSQSGRGVCTPVVDGHGGIYVITTGVGLVLTGVEESSNDLAGLAVNKDPSDPEELQPLEVGLHLQAPTSFVQPEVVEDGYHEIVENVVDVL